MALTEEVYTSMSTGGPTAGDNLWAWSGQARPGDDWVGDPPHEIPGWYSVYDTDESTKVIISAHVKEMARAQEQAVAIDFVSVICDSQRTKCLLYPEQSCKRSNSRPSSDGDKRMIRKLNRRQFIKLSGAAVAAALLSGCTSKPQPTATPTNTPAPTDTPAPIEVRRPAVVRFYPDVPSKVVLTHHAGVWNSGELVPETLRQMLDTSITELTGLMDAAEAWNALFAPHERVAIKVNAGWSGIHVPLVLAVTDRLQEAGIRPEQIVIFEDHTDRLEIAGFPINDDGPGVRCYGNAGWHPADWRLIDTDIKLNAILMSCNALINMPVLKGHAIAGISCAMKNHYGSFSKPYAFHPPRLNQGIAGLNALPPIKDRTRLIIGDVLDLNVGRSRCGDSILVSFDPVAHDAAGLRLYTELLNSAERSTEAALHLASGWLEAAANLGVGTQDPNNMDLVEIEVP